MLTTDRTVDPVTITSLGPITNSLLSETPISSQVSADFRFNPLLVPSGKFHEPTAALRGYGDDSESEVI